MAERTPICVNCADYAEDPRIELRAGDWVHVTNGEARCPGQEDDDTDDRVIARMMTPGDLEHWGIDPTEWDQS